MPPSPVQLKDKLLKAIDEDNNVINATLVLEVIGHLEKIALTGEDLKATRLGLYINNVRKKTADQDLAKRCRKLVKAWLQLVNPTPSNNASPAPGYNSPALSVSRQSPASSAYLSSSPALQPAANTKRTSPASIQIAATAPERLVSPLVRHQSGRSSPAAAHLKRISPSNSRLTTPNSSATPTIPSVSPNQPSSRPSTPNNATHLNNTVRNHTPTPISSNNHSNFTPHLDTTNRTHAANKKRRRSDESNNSDATSFKKTRTVVNGESTRLTERIKTPKVKTTAQLIEELQVQKSTRLTKSDTINKIVTNQIQKEEDDINVSVVPASARPKSRVRKNGSSGLPNPPADLSKAKSELVERYLETHRETHLENQLTDDSEIDIIGDNSDNVRTNRCSKKNNNKAVINRSIDPYSLLPPLDYDNIAWSDDEEEVDAPIRKNAITGEYPDGYERSESSCNTPNDESIEKVINHDWNGVNGTVNVNSKFHTWTETFTIQPGGGEQTDAHVLLPYVDL